MSKKKVTTILLAVFAFFLVPIGTLLLASKLPLTNYNLSDIGNEYGYRVEFLIWGISVTIYFILMIYHFFKKYQVKKGYYISLFVSAITMITALLIPYFPKENAFLAGRHIDLAMVGLTCLLVTFFLFLVQLQLKVIANIKIAIMAFLTILLITFFCYTFYGMINSLLELIFVSLFSIYLYLFKQIYIP